MQTREVSFFLTHFQIAIQALANIRASSRVTKSKSRCISKCDGTFCHVLGKLVVAWADLGEGCKGCKGCEHPPPPSWDGLYFLIYLQFYSICLHQLSVTSFTGVGRCGLNVRALARALCCVLGQDTLLSQCLSPPRCINGYRPIYC